MTPAQIATRNRFLYEIIDVARERGFTRAVCEDFATRAVLGGKVFLNNETGELDTVAGYGAREFVEVLSEDPSAKHLFKQESKPDTATVYGIPADKFEKLSAMQRLELANKHASKSR